ncbi:TPA: hypothetical protein G9F27_005708, partial [Salmonella enterica]|nr:hypothetical protein [Salmonella enterica]
MRYILLFIAMTGGLLSFNSYAADCPAGLKIPSGAYIPVINGILVSDNPFSINISGCEYKPIDINYIVYTEGPLKDGIFSSNGYISTGDKVLPGNSYSVHVNSSGLPDTEDKPDSGSSGDSSTSPISDTNSGSSLPDDYAGETAGSTD